MSQNCCYQMIHIVFGTRGRTNRIPTGVEPKLHQYLGGIAKNRRCVPIAINGMQDHVHLLLNLHPSESISVMVRTLKSYSSRWMKQQGYPDFGWQSGYGAFSVSLSMRDRVEAYIRNQKKHHSTTPFADEMRAMAKRHGLAWE